MRDKLKGNGLWYLNLFEALFSLTSDLLFTPLYFIYVNYTFIASLKPFCVLLDMSQYVILELYWVRFSRTRSYAYIIQMYISQHMKDLLSVSTARKR